jgi:hypothetical protein
MRGGKLEGRGGRGRALDCYILPIKTTTAVQRSRAVSGLGGCHPPPPHGALLLNSNIINSATGGDDVLVLFVCCRRIPQRPSIPGCHTQTRWGGQNRQSRSTSEDVMSRTHDDRTIAAAARAATGGCLETERALLPANAFNHPNNRRGRTDEIAWRAHTQLPQQCFQE